VATAIERMMAAALNSFIGSLQGIMTATAGTGTGSSGIKADREPAVQAGFDCSLPRHTAAQATMH
jgi:hypothetical protein